jgi:hypothetical protein
LGLQLQQLVQLLLAQLLLVLLLPSYLVLLIPSFLVLLIQLQQVLLYNKGHLDAGLVLTMHALEQATAASKLQSLREASHVFGQGKDTGFH